MDLLGGSICGSIHCSFVPSVCVESWCYEGLWVSQEPASRASRLEFDFFFKLSKWWRFLWARKEGKKKYQVIIIKFYWWVTFSVVFVTLRGRFEGDFINQFAISTPVECMFSFDVFVIYILYLSMLLYLMYDVSKLLSFYLFNITFFLLI